MREKEDGVKFFLMEKKENGRKEREKKRLGGIGKKMCLQFISFRKEGG